MVSDVFQSSPRISFQQTLMGHSLEVLVWASTFIEWHFSGGFAAIHFSRIHVVRHVWPVVFSCPTIVHIFSLDVFPNVKSASSIEYVFIVTKEILLYLPYLRGGYVLKLYPCHNYMQILVDQ